MGIEVKAQKAKLRGYGLVRNSEGKPQFDNWDNIPEIFHAALSEADWEYIKLMRNKICQ